MQYHNLSGSGVRISRLGIGTATFGVAPTVAESATVIAHALDSGINYIDTANSYGNQPRFDREGAPAAGERESAEELVGAVLAGRRDDVVLATKVSEAVVSGPNGGGFGGGGLSRYHIMRQVEASLRRLRTDHIDIYYAHHPDRLTDVEDTLATFDHLIQQGKIRYYALSTYAGWQLTEAVLTARRGGLRPPICHQTRYSLAKRFVEGEVLPAANRFGINTVAFSPLAGGLLAGVGTSRRYAGEARWGGRGFSEQEIALADALAERAANWGYESSNLALAWLLSRPGLACAIVGPESKDELAALAPAVDLDLSTEQLAELEALGTAPPGMWD